jgi:hypothetical protein
VAYRRAGETYRRVGVWAYLSCKTLTQSEVFKERIRSG